MASLWHNQKEEEKKERLQKARFFFRESFLFLHPPPPANIVIDVLVSAEAFKKNYQYDTTGASPL